MSVYNAFIFLSKTWNIMSPKTGKEVFKMKKIMNKKVLGYAALALACVMLGSVMTTALQPAASAETPLTPVASPYTAAITLVKDSIVGVNNYQIVNYNNYGNNYGYGFPWGDFFGYGYGNGNGNNNRRSEEVEYGSGSGVVVAKNYVLTNYHVVENASSLKVVINRNDDAEPELLEATVAASDSDLDVAVLYVPELQLDPVTLGDSDALQVGDYVFNIGNPLGFTNTVTAGIVSALNREISTGSTTDRYGRKSSIVNTMIQTDAAINSGNSGGGMFNTAGELVGIPTLKYTGSRYSSNATIESIGMCIPINDAKSVIDAALNGKGGDLAADEGSRTEDNRGQNGNVNNGLSGKPRLGITTTTLNGAAVSGGVLPNGAYVISVDSGSPAEAGGMQVGDIIVEANSEIITTTTDLINLLSGLKEGDEVNLKVFRTGVDLTAEDAQIPTDGEYVDLTVVLAIVDAIAQ